MRNLAGCIVGAGVCSGVTIPRHRGNVYTYNQRGVGGAVVHKVMGISVVSGVFALLGASYTFPQRFDLNTGLLILGINAAVMAFVLTRD